jgi:hypothetical protein
MTISIQYRFIVNHTAMEAFDLTIDPVSLELIDFDPPPGKRPPWTRLDYHRCPNCLLRRNQHPYCPLSLKLVKIVNRFSALLSYDQIVLEVTTSERRIIQSTTAQRAIGSLMGLVSATSGCPHTVYFKPMARFHLPLANEEETICRAVSMYLLAQYFCAPHDFGGPRQLEGLRDIYENIQVVNMSIAHRLRAASQTDSTVNAIIILDTFARAIPYVIEESLEEIRYLFRDYILRSRTAKAPSTDFQRNRGG